MEYSFSQEIYFSNKKSLLVSDVAKSLLSLSKVSKLTPQVIERLFEGTIISDIELYIDNLESGSLTERIKYYFSLAVQKKIDGLVGGGAPTLDGANSERFNNIAAWVMALLLLYGLKVGADKVFSNQPRENLKNEVNIVINTGVEVTGVDKETIQKTIREVVQKNPDLPKNAIEFAKPAKSDPSASITYDQRYKISEKALSEVPFTIYEDDKTEHSVRLENTEIRIRATDKDYAGRGWGAIIPAFYDRRVKMNVDPSIDLSELAHADVVYGDIVVFHQLDDEGNIKKPHAHLYKLYKEKKN